MNLQPSLAGPPAGAATSSRLASIAAAPRARGPPPPGNTATCRNLLNLNNAHTTRCIALIYVYIYIYSFDVCMYICVYVYICMYISLSLYIYIYIYIYTHTYLPPPPMLGGGSSGLQDLAAAVAIAQRAGGNGARPPLQGGVADGGVEGWARGIAWDLFEELGQSSWEGRTALDNK